MILYIVDIKIKGNYKEKTGAKKYGRRDINNNIEINTIPLNEPTIAQQLPFPEAKKYSTLVIKIVTTIY